MGIFDVVKDAIWDDTPTAGSKPATDSASGPTRVSPVHAAPVPTGSDPVMRKRLLDRVTMSLPPSCKELMEQLTLLAEDVPDERSRFRAAIKSVVRNGHPMVEVAADLERTILVVDAERDRFEADLKVQTDSRIGSKTALVDQIDASVAEKRKRVSDLEVEIQALGAEKASVSESIREDSLTISQSRDQFISTHAAVRSEFVTIRDKTKTYSSEIQK